MSTDRIMFLIQGQDVDSRLDQAVEVGLNRDGHVRLRLEVDGDVMTVWLSLSEATLLRDTLTETLEEATWP